MRILLPPTVFLAVAQDAAKSEQQAEAQPIVGELHVFFSPKGGCTEAIVKQFDAAQKSIEVEAYSLEFRSRSPEGTIVISQGRKLLESNENIFLALKGRWDKNSGADTPIRLPLCVFA
jgi:hypothetical protein